MGRARKGQQELGPEMGRARKGQKELGPEMGNARKARKNRACPYIQMSGYFASACLQTMGRIIIRYIF